VLGQLGNAQAPFRLPQDFQQLEGPLDGCYVLGHGSVSTIQKNVL